MTMKIS